jgi:hypothetical protein
VDAAVVELDPLSDPVWPRAEDDHARLIPAPYLAGAAPAALPRRVVVRRFGLELGGARVHRLERALAAEGGVGVGGQLPQLVQKPRVDPRAALELLGVGAATQRLHHEVEALGAGRLKALEHLVQRAVEARRGVELA